MIRFLSSIVRTAAWVARRETLPQSDPVERPDPAEDRSIVRTLLESGEPLPVADLPEHESAAEVPRGRTLFSGLLESEDLPLRGEPAGKVPLSRTMFTFLLERETLPLRGEPPTGSSRPPFLGNLLRTESLALAPVPQPGGPGRGRSLLGTLLEREALPPDAPAGSRLPGPPSEPE